MSPKVHRLETFVHIITSFVLLLKGLEKIDHHYVLSGTVIMALGVVVLVLALFGKRLGISHFRAKISWCIIEFVALSLTTYVYWHDGRPFFLI